MPPLDDAEFAKRLFQAATPMAKIKLAIQEDRFSIWSRPENLPEIFLEDVLRLADNFPVRAEPRRSGGTGLPQVYELNYTSRVTGQPLRVYLKGFFKSDGFGITELSIQSLKEDI